MARRKLNEQQRSRIEKIQQQRRDKANQRADNALADSADTEQLEGRVVVRHGQNLLVRKVDGSDVHCLFRQNLGEIVCGDDVLWQATDNQQGVVTAVQPRDTALSRPDYSGRDKPIAANITQLIVVLAPEPEPTGYLLDQYLIAAERIGVKAAICLNKADLMNEEQQAQFCQRFGHYEKMGYPLVQVSAKSEQGLDPLLNSLKGNVNILVGQSGVGKSSLINALLPDPEIEEGELSDASKLGKHTTSAATLYPLLSGGEIIDSPGVRSFRLGKIERRELEFGYPEIRNLIGSCKFNNCAHKGEPNCAVQAALNAGEIHPDRLNSFLHMSEELN